MGKVRPSLAVAAAALLAAFTLAACGDDNGGGEDEDQITEAIEFAATSGDPKACTQVQTARFTQQTSGVPGGSAEKAVRNCEQEAENAPAEEAEVSSIEIDDDTATAEAALTGSFLDGQTLEISLIKEGDQWKLDELTGLAEFNREAFVSAFRKAVSSEGGASPEAVDCVVGQLNAQSDEDLQDFIIGSDPQAEEAIFRPCTKFFD